MNLIFRGIVELIGWILYGEMVNDCNFLVVKSLPVPPHGHMGIKRVLLFLDLRCPGPKYAKEITELYPV